MYSSSIFTVTAAFALILLIATLCMQFMEMQTYGMF